MLPPPAPVHPAARRGCLSRLTDRLAHCAAGGERLGLAVLTGVRDAALATLPAKLAGLGLLLWCSRIDEDEALISSAFGWAAGAATALGAAAFLATSVQGREEPDRQGKVAGAALMGAAIGAAAAGVPAMALVGAVSLAGGAAGLAAQSACLRPGRHAAVFTALGVMLACGALVSLQWPQRERVLTARISEHADSFHAKQFAALVEALITEGMKDMLGRAGPAVDRGHISMRGLCRAALLTLPFDAAARIGLSGFVGLAVRPPEGHRRYDEYVPAALLACCGDLIKGLTGTFLLAGMTAERRPAQGLKAPGRRTLQRLPIRLFMLTARNTLYETIAARGKNVAAAIGVSQGFYALATVAREPLHDWLDRRGQLVAADFATGDHAPPPLALNPASAV